MRSRQLQAALAAFVEEAASRLHACVLAGEEVPFELASRSARGRGAAPLYCYQPLTSAFLAERFPSLSDLPAYGEALAQLSNFDGLDRYLLARDVRLQRSSSVRASASAALLALLQDVFEEQTDFELHPERLQRALARVEGSALANPAEVTLVGTLHGLAIASQELRLTSGLTLAQPEALEGVPEQVADALLVVFSAEDPEPRSAIEQGREVLHELLRALRLFGDGRIALGPVAWSRIAGGPWSALALGTSGHPHGTLLVTPDQEDELRAFCNLISRRTPREGPIAWALRRFELGCERSEEYEALSDHLLALRALLAGPSEADPAGGAAGLLAARLAALCATPEHRAAATERTLAAIALERAIVTGTAVQHAGGLELARTLSNHLRALLRDLICGHLPCDLVSLADELLLSGGELGGEVGGEPEGEVGDEEGEVGGELGGELGAEEVLGDEPQIGEVLDVAI